MHGTLQLRQVDLALQTDQVTVEARGPAGSVAAMAQNIGNRTRVDLGGEQTIGAGETLTIRTR